MSSKPDRKKRKTKQRRIRRREEQRKNRRGLVGQLADAEQDFSKTERALKVAEGKLAYQQGLHTGTILKLGQIQTGDHRTSRDPSMEEITEALFELASAKRTRDLTGEEGEEVTRLMTELRGRPVVMNDGTVIDALDKFEAQMYEKIGEFQAGDHREEGAEDGIHDDE